jgi:hypothetical protein
VKERNMVALRRIAIALGLFVFTIALIAGWVMYQDGQRDEMAAQTLRTQQSLALQISEQMKMLNQSLAKRAAMILPYCASDQRSLFDDAIDFTPSLPTNLTGQNGALASPQPGQSQMPSPPPPPPPAGGIVKANGSINQASQVPSSSPPPSPIPVLVQHSIGFNVTGPLPEIIDAVNSVSHRPSGPVISAYITQLSQGSSNDNVSAVVTLVQTRITDNLCSEAKVDATLLQPEKKKTTLQAVLQRKSLRQASVPIRAHPSVSTPLLLLPSPTHAPLGLPKGKAS